MRMAVIVSTSSLRSSRRMLVVMPSAALLALMRVLRGLLVVVVVGMAGLRGMRAFCMSMRVLVRLDISFRSSRRLGGLIMSMSMDMCMRLGLAVMMVVMSVTVLLRLAAVTMLMLMIMFVLVFMLVAVLVTVVEGVPSGRLLGLAVDPLVALLLSLQQFLCGISMISKRVSNV